MILIYVLVVQVPCIVNSLTQTRAFPALVECSDSCLMLPYGIDEGDFELDHDNREASPAIPFDFPLFGTLFTEVYVSMLFST